MQLGCSALDFAKTSIDAKPALSMNWYHCASHGEALIVASKSILV